MTGSRETQAFERALFERFAKAAGLDIDLGSITQPDPPDIVCNVAGFGSVGFELTAVDDVGALTRMALLARTDEFWAQALENLDPRIRAGLRADHSNVQVSLVYAEPGSTKQRRTAMRTVLERLAAKPRDFVGHLYNPFDLIAPEARPAAVSAAREEFKRRPPGSVRNLDDLIDPPPPGIESADVRRSTSISQGPTVFSISPFGFEPVTLGRIDAKAGREDYRSDRRLELLAYVRWGDPASLEDRDCVFRSMLTADSV
jgi:hypothetical protein